MEPCEKDYILKNIYNLTSNTLCNYKTLIILVEKGVITNEEYQFLSAKNLSHGSMPAAMELYQIAIMRSNGYNYLIDALYQSGQTGAVSLLLDAPFGANPPVHMVEAQAKLLQDFEVQIFDNKLSFKEMFPNLSTKELTEILYDVNANKEFRRLQRTNETLLKLQTYTPPLRPFYIPRSISNRLLLREELFKCTQREFRDVFVFTGIGWKDLAELIKPHLLQSSTSQRWSITCRHIYLEHKDDWNDILERAKTPVHLINFDGKNYLLQNSNRTTTILLQNSYRSDKLPYVTEDEFVEQILAERNGVLLCDIPGMGKTCLMESLAKKIQSVSTARIVFFIALTHLAKHLEEKQWSKECNNNVELILEYACQSKLATSVLCGSDNEKMPNLIFVCDGFDEIMETSVEKTTLFLKDLRSNPNVKLLISSRPHKRKYLETTFELASFDLLPLSLNEQLGFLVQHWQGKLGSNEKNVALEEFASQCVRSLHILKGDPISKLLGTPLICSLLAVINEDNAQRLSASNRNRRLAVPEHILVNSVSELYEKFVNFCLKNLPEDKQENIIAYHIYYALKLVFPALADTYIRAKRLIINDLDLVQFGIISEGGEFSHRSFAEYFVSKFFAEFYQNISVLDTEFVSIVGCKFVSKFLKKSYTLMHINYLMLNREENKFSAPFWHQYLIVLHFMNGEFNNYSNQQALSIRVEELSPAHLKMLKPLICSPINEFLFVTLYLNLEKLISFYINFIKILFSNDEERIAFLTENTPLETYSRLLCFAAKYGGSVAVNLVFSLYDNSEENWLASKFKHWNFGMKTLMSDNWKSPLEIAIERRDIDLVECFYGKVPMIPDQLCMVCLSGRNFGPNAGNDDKILRIMNRVLPERYEIHHLTEDLICQEKYEVYDLCGLLIGLAYLRRTSLTSLRKITKEKVLSRIIKNSDDEIFIKTLLLLFHRDALAKSNSTFETGLNNDHHLTELTADQILSLLNITAVKETLGNQKRRTDYVKFANMAGLETLNILLAICPSFSKCDYYERNYMHMAVNQGKPNWVDHLIKLGHDVNQQDIHGKTPLLSVSKKTEPEIVTCLVEHEADIYSVNNISDNFVHRLLSSVTTEDSVSPHFFSTWINFIFKNKYNKLFEMKNSNGRTPISLLVQKYNEQADLVFSMHGECQFMPREVKAALLERAILWSNDRELIKLLVEMFPVCENPYDRETDDLHLMNHSDAFVFNSDTVLHLIDITEAKETAQNVLISKFVKITEPFQIIKNTETLKILLEIIPDFSCRNFEHLNYMHLSVAQGKVEWLEHLIALDHDVNQQDKRGNTPVFYLSGNNTMVIFRLLVESGTNLCHIVIGNETFAHKFLRKNIPYDLVIEWTRYMLLIGAHDIWHINGNSWPFDTPFKLLYQRMGNRHPITGEVLAAAPYPSGPDTGCH